MGITYSTDELVRLVRKEGWVLDRTVGSHQIFTHGSKPGIVVIPRHTKDIPKGTANSILKQAGLK